MMSQDHQKDLSSITKITELLRHFKILKKSKKQQKFKQKIKNKCESLLSQVGKSQKCKDQLKRLIQSTFQEYDQNISLSAIEIKQHSVQDSAQSIINKMNSPQKEKVIDSISEIKNQSISEIKNNNLLSNASQNHQRKLSREENSSASMIQDYEKINTFQEIPYSPKKREEMQNSFSESDNQIQSLDGSKLEQAIELSITKICKKNCKNITQIVRLNKQLIGFVKNQPQIVSLFGIYNPKSCYFKSIFGCTVTKFSKYEIFKKQYYYDKQQKEFRSSLRIPLGLIIVGDSIQELDSKYIQFLNNFKSPYPVVVMMSNLATYEGKIYCFDSELVNEVRMKGASEALSLRMRDQAYCTSLHQSQIDQSFEFVKTKFLERKVEMPANEGKDAKDFSNMIQIMSSGVIQQEEVIFPYKFHNKMFSVSKSDFMIYYTNNNVISTRVCFKTIEEFREEAKKRDKGIMAVTVKDEEKTSINKQFFEICLKTAEQRDPFITVYLSHFSKKKIANIVLKKDVTSEMIQTSPPITFKSIQQGNAITLCVNVILSKNHKEFECKDVELLEIKGK